MGTGLSEGPRLSTRYERTGNLNLEVVINHIETALKAIPDDHLIEQHRWAT